MTLIHNEPESKFELRDGKLLILWFKWDPERNEYVTDKGEHLGPAWSGAVESAKSKAVARTMKPARTKERFK